jgi:hypothetical protein
MEQHSLTEILLDGLIDETGLEPEGDLLDRLAAAPTAVLRGLRSKDAESFGIAAMLPLDLAPVLTELLVTCCDADGRFDREAADRLIAARAQGPEAEVEEHEPEPILVRLVHEALGLDVDCAACAALLEEEPLDQDVDEDSGGGHHQADSPLAQVASRHPAEMDAWEPQFALRIGRDAGQLFHAAAGFDALHDVVTGGGAPGLTPDALENAHDIQHVGFGQCEGAAEVHGFRVALRALHDTAGVAAGIEAAERAVADDTLELAALPAEVAVSLIADHITDALDSAPTPAPTRRLPKGKRRR